MNQTIITNPEQQLYVIPCGDGYTCWGFENCFTEGQTLARLLKQSAPKPSEKGTLEQYMQVRDLQRQYAERPDLNQKTWFDPNTVKPVQNALERLRRERRRVRIFLGDPKTGRSWLEEWDVIGRIGRSMGPMRVPLLVPMGEAGGGAILTQHIIRIMDEDRKDWYRHPGFHVPPILIQPSKMKGYNAEAWIEGSCHARFKTDGEAQRWRLFMQGELFDWMTLLERRRLEKE